MIKLINTALAQVNELVPCLDGTWADPSLGCVSPTPGSIIDPQSSIVEIILKVGSGLAIIATVIAVVALTYGGIKYSSAMGDEEKSAEAKRIIYWSIFGLVGSLLANSVVNFIVGILS